MKGETTVNERIERRLHKIEELRTFLNRWYRSLDPATPNSADWASDMVSALTEYACYLALYEGVDYDTVAGQTVEETRAYFPDIIG